MAKQLGHHSPLGAFRNLGSWVQQRSLGPSSLSILDLKTFYPQGFPTVPTENSDSEPGASAPIKRSDNESPPSPSDKPTVARQVDTSVSCQKVQTPITQETSPSVTTATTASIKTAPGPTTETEQTVPFRTSLQRYFLPDEVSPLSEAETTATKTDNISPTSHLSDITLSDITSDIPEVPKTSEHKAERSTVETVYPPAVRSPQPSVADVTNSIQSLKASPSTPQVSANVTHSDTISSVQRLQETPETQLFPLPKQQNPAAALPLSQNQSLQRQPDETFTTTPTRQTARAASQSESVQQTTNQTITPSEQLSNSENHYKSQQKSTAHDETQLVSSQTTLSSNTATHSTESVQRTAEESQPPPLIAPDSSVLTSSIHHLESPQHSANAPLQRTAAVSPQSVTPASESSSAKTVSGQPVIHQAVSKPNIQKSPDSSDVNPLASSDKQRSLTKKLSTKSIQRDIVKSSQTDAIQADIDQSIELQPTQPTVETVFNTTVQRSSEVQSDHTAPKSYLSESGNEYLQNPLTKVQQSSDSASHKTIPSEDVSDSLINSSNSGRLPGVLNPLGVLKPLNNHTVAEMTSLSKNRSQLRQLNPKNNTNIQRQQDTVSMPDEAKNNTNIQRQQDTDGMPEAWSNLADLVTHLQSGQTSDRGSTQLTKPPQSTNSKSTGKTISDSKQSSSQPSSQPINVTKPATVTVQRQNTSPAAATKPTIIQACKDESAADTASSANTKEQIDANHNYSQSLELLVQEVYSLLRQRLSLEQERRGPKYPR